MSAVYFFLFGALGALVPFLALFYRAAGLSAREISILLSVIPVMLVISQPIFGPLTDRSGHRGRMLAWLFLAASLSGGLIALGTGFWSLLPLVMLWAFFAGPLVPIADSIALGEVQRTGVGFPQLRLWGSVGFVLVTTLFGRLYNSIDLRWMFGLYALMCLLAFGLARRLPADGLSNRRELLPVLKELLRSPILVAFLLLSAILQTTQAAHAAFFSIHMDSLGGSSFLVGLAWGFAAVVEVPVWLVLSRVTQRTGPLPLLAFATAIYALRWFLYAVAPTPWTLLALQGLHGLSFGIFMPTAVVLVGELTPAELRTSGQALLVLVNGGIATVIGNLTAGHIVDLSGTAALYRVAAYVAATACIGFILLVRRSRRGVPAN
ncbi:MAG: MFS transporter [Bacillota bacterium]